MEEERFGNDVKNDGQMWRVMLAQSLKGHCRSFQGWKKQQPDCGGNTFIKFNGKGGISLVDCNDMNNDVIVRMKQIRVSPKCGRLRGQVLIYLFNKHRALYIV